MYLIRHHDHWRFVPRAININGSHPSHDVSASLSSPSTLVCLRHNLFPTRSTLHRQVDHYTHSRSNLITRQPKCLSNSPPRHSRPTSHPPPLRSPNSLQRQHATPRRQASKCGTSPGSATPTLIPPTVQPRTGKSPGQSARTPAPVIPKRTSPNAATAGAAQATSRASSDPAP